MKQHRVFLYHGLKEGAVEGFPESYGSAYCLVQSTFPDEVPILSTFFVKEALSDSEAHLEASEEMLRRLRGR